MERVGRILGDVPLRQPKDRYPGELFARQRKGVALARAIVIKPDRLLLDEPLTDPDADPRGETREDSPLV
jgi:iron(III) transport system ATP-binding protein